jgi:hypothetical protein
MAIDVFLILCGLSVAFLVYVLVQLWNEGRRRGAGAEPAMLFHRPWNPDLVVVTHPISLNAHGGISVIPLQPQTQTPETSAAQGRKNAQVLQMPARENRHGEWPPVRDSKRKVR